MKKAAFKAFLYSFILLFLSATTVFAQNQEDHSSDQEEVHSEDRHEEMTYNDKVLHHISDANEFHIIGDISLPLPVILYDFKEGKFSFFMSSAFEHGHKAVDGYVMDHGDVKKVIGEDFPEETVHIDGIEHGTEEDQSTYVNYDGSSFKLQKASTLLNLGTSTFIDFSITKNVFTMMLAGLLLIIIFVAVRNGYRKNEGQAPSGIQSLMEPFIVFIRDEIAKPAIGNGWEKYFPFIACLFFFILMNNLLGLVPFFPGSGNVMGNVGVTLALALVVFIVTNFSANKHYWQHIFWMPGVPYAIRPILAVIEFLGLFTKPFTLFIRLFANITAGHIIILSLVGLIFILGNNGESVAGIVGGGAIAVPFVFAMNLLEIFVGVLQAFIFALLAALYIGEATATAEAH